MSATMARSPAGFWKRYVAYSIDLLLVWIVLEIVGRLFFPAAGTGELDQLRSLMASAQNPQGESADQTVVLTQAMDLLWRLMLWSSVAYVAIGGAWFVLFESSRWQATPGKRLVGIKVTDADGAPITPARAAGRFLAAGLSWLTLNVGHALAAWTPDRRALHDMIAGTRVENADPSQPRMPWWGWLVIAVQALAFVLMIVAMATATLATIEAANQF